ncbi:MAG: hypothetical protein JKP90_19425 [Desulfofustis sp. PB-SRB1]|nr:hypothetical protein [Desulfofustis sp. PB-SRB1]
MPVEIKARELHGKMLLALCAAEAGFAVVIGRQKVLREQLHNFPAGLYLDKSVAVSKERWFKRFRNLGNRVVAWDEEGLVIHEEQYLKSRISERALALTDLFFAWGAAQRDILANAFVDREQMFVLAGNPRFDLLRVELRGLYSDAAERLRDRYGHIILINTNFGFYNHFKGAAEAKRIFSQSSSHADERFIDNWIDYQEKLFHAFAAVLPWLGERFSQHTIIVRPHPSENEERWQVEAGRVANVRVVKEGSVIEWIMASDVMVHSNCTTGIEAYLLGVPPIAYRPVTSEIYETFLPNALSKSVYSFDSFKACMSELLSSDEAAPDWLANDEKQKICSAYISGTSGQLASDCIVENLTALVDSSGQWKADQSLSRRFQVLLNQLRTTKDFLLRWKSVYRRAERYDRLKFPHLQLRELEEIGQRFTDLTGRFDDIAVSEFTKECFMLRRISR